MNDVLSIVNAAHQALTALHSTTASPSTVTEAQARLQQIKQLLNPLTVIPVAQHLLSPILSPTPNLNSQQLNLQIPHIHYGFHLLDELLFRTSSPWSSLPSDICLSVRHLSVLVFNKISAVDPAGNPVQQLPQLIIEKAVALMSSVAIREWPQRWPDFLDILLLESTRADLTCHVLRVLSEDVHDFPDVIAPLRRQELNQAMALTLPQTLNFIIASADAFHIQRRYDALRTVLACLESFLSWASLHAVFAACAPQACITLLENKDTRLSALSALRVLVQRYFATTEIKSTSNDPQTRQLRMVQGESAFRDIVFSGVVKFASTPTVLTMVGASLLLSVGAMPGLSDARGLAARLLEIDDEEYEFLVNFFAMLSELGGVHFASSFFLTKTLTDKPSLKSDEQCGAAFIELMLAAITCPSLAIRSSCLSFFVSSLSSIEKHKKTAAIAPLGFFLTTGYLHAAALGLLSFANDKITSLLDDLEFGGDQRRRKECLESFRARTISCIGLVCKHVPVLGRTVGLKRLYKLMSNPVSENSNASAESSTVLSVVEKDQGTDPRFLRFIVSDSTQHGWEFGSFEKMSRLEWAAALDATIAATEAMIAGVTASGALDEHHNAFQLMEMSLSLVLKISDESLLLSKANAFRIFIPLYMKNSSSLNLCIRSLISQISSCTPKGPGRFRACSSLSAICRRLGSAKVDTLGQLRKPLCEYTAQVLASSEFQVIDKVFMLESSIATVQIMDTVLEQADWIDKLMQPLLETLASDVVRSVLHSPTSLLKFMTSADVRDLERVLESFQLVETCAQTIVKPLSKAKAQIEFPSVLSRYVAPQAVEVSSRLVVVLHSMYNSSKFPFNDTTGVGESLLYPTSREMTFLLNLEGITAHTMKNLDYANGKADLQNAIPTEEHSEEVLRQFGIEPPNSYYAGPRETLKTLRRSGYEIMRSAILSGVTRSPSHLNTLLQSISEDYQYIEPIHLLHLTNKVLRPLLSFSVVSADASFLESVARSNTHELFKSIREHIEAARKGDNASSSTATLDVARDHGRKLLARASADLICNMYPRLDTAGTKKVEGGVQPEVIYVPETFSYAPLGEVMMGLWKTLCSPGRGFLDNGAARVAFGTVCSAVQLAPINTFHMFSQLLLAGMQTAVENDGLVIDSPLENAIGAALAIIRKWPKESEMELIREVAKYGEFMAIWVKECIANIYGSEHIRSKPKKHRSALRTLTGKIAESIGISQRVKSKVHALPEKLVANNPSRSRNRDRQDQDDLLLGDEALDSLFGEGDPL